MSFVCFPKIYLKVAKDVARMRESIEWLYRGVKEMRKAKREWMAIIDACKVIGISYGTLQKKCASGRLKTRRRGEGKTAKIFVHCDDVNRLRDAYQVIG